MQHWKTELDSDQILWVYCDRADSATNTLNVAVMQELETILTDIDEKAASYRGVVIASKKSNGFIAGADIDQFKLVETYEQAKPVIERGQAVFNQLESLKVPTLALISGFCLGGGLELALACRYRIADLDPKTQIGLPETKLGILPGWGGTLRLTRLIGPYRALPLILNGQFLNAKKAAAFGIVDAALPKRLLRPAAKTILLEDKGPHQASFFHRFLNAGFCRPLLAMLMRREAKKVVSPEHYPAPFQVIDNWLKHGVNAKPALAAEADSICRLLLTETSKNLVRVFRLQEMLKNLGKQGETTLKHVHVIGAGTMGGDIAAWCAYKGFTVTLQDREAKYIAPAMGRAAKLFQKKYKGDKRLVKKALDLLIPDPVGDGVKHADIIIEAIFEDLSVKQALFKSLEQEAKQGTILASNTSSIPLEEIATVMQDPTRLVGIHFFNPVAKMPLVEVVKSKQTDDQVMTTAMSFVGQLSKLPLPVQSKPGFLVNRVLMPYLMECVTLLQEGFSGPAIDLAAKQFGMPMGPVELADRVGLDVCLSVAKNLTSHFGGEIPPKLIEMVEAGHLGAKTKQGFYTYDKMGKPEKADVKLTEAESIEISMRLVMRMVNEAAACLREEVVDNADLLDAGMIFGTGFAPFRGGLMHYVKQMGSTELQAQLMALEETFGYRFRPDAYLEKVVHEEAVTLH